MFLKLKSAIKNIVYEAGPTGYALARELQNANLPVHVIAPSKTPRPSARQSKTDSLDCRKLAEYAAKKMLRPIAIPTQEQEQDRQICRLRDQLMDKLRRVKIQIKSFLLQHGIEELSGLKAWANYALDSLRKIKLPHQLRYCLDMLLNELDFLKQQLRKLEQQLKELFSQKPHHQTIQILQTHPGVGPTVARQFATEVFNPKRFKNKTELAKYVGLSPMVTQSGQSQRDGPITKTGRPQLRSNLIQAAWIWIRSDRHGKNLYYKLLRNTGQKNKAVTAMARKMAVNLWRMACDNKPYVMPNASL
jgi:transposase